MTQRKRIGARALAGCLYWAYAAFLLTSLLIWMFGDSGLDAYADLDAYRARLEANVARLESLNARLASDARLAEGDAGTIRLLARGIGLYAPGERVIRIRGYAPTSPAYEVGDLLRYRVAERGRSRTFKILGVSLPLAMAALSVVLRILAARRA